VRFPVIACKRWNGQNPLEQESRVGRTGWSVTPTSRPGSGLRRDCRVMHEAVLARVLLHERLKECFSRRPRRKRKARLHFSVGAEYGSDIHRIRLGTDARYHRG
jgi:hypothetical protein